MKLNCKEKERDVKHTQGSWVVEWNTEDDFKYRGILKSSTGQQILKFNAFGSLETVEANLRLIAAAPDLLDMVKDIDDDWLSDYELESKQLREMEEL